MILTGVSMNTKWDFLSNSNEIKHCHTHTHYPSWRSNLLSYTLLFPTQFTTQGQMVTTVVWKNNWSWTFPLFPAAPSVFAHTEVKKKIHPQTHNVTI